MRVEDMVDRASPLERARRQGLSVRAPSVRVLVPACLLILVLCGLLLALDATGQTPPPRTGDWVIDDVTSVQDASIDIQGNISVGRSAMLSLSNVSLRFTGPGHHELNVSLGRLFIVNGNISAPDGSFTVVINGAASLSNVTIDDSEGLRVWGDISIVGCTIHAPQGDGIQVAEPPQAVSPDFYIIGNVIDLPTGSGIDVTIPEWLDPGQLQVNNNTVNGAGEDGIHVTAKFSSGTIWLTGNRVNGSGGHGMLIALDVDKLELSLDDNEVQGSGLDGIHVEVTKPATALHKLYNLTATGNHGTGVHIEAIEVALDWPTFRWWDVGENQGAGIRLLNVTNATLHDSIVMNPRAAYDYECVGSDLVILYTQHRQARAEVSPGHRVVSYRYLNLTAVWQNGEPADLKHVRFLDEAYAEVFGAISDGAGWLGNYTVWDWEVASAAVKVRGLLHPVMTLRTGNVTSPDLPMGSDITAGIPFIDDVTPVLLVMGPSEGSHIGTTIVTISGACLDEESGPWLVQVSLDPTEAWSEKSWMDVDGLNPWVVKLGPLLDGEYDIFVRAFDIANFPDGAFAMYVVENLTIDTTLPLILLDPPVDGLIINRTAQELRGRTDPEIDVVLLNGGPLRVYGGIFYTMLTLVDGFNHFSIEAVDLAGNVATAHVTILVDREPPEFRVIGPANGTVSIDEHITVSGMNLKDNADRVFVDGIEVQCVGTFTTSVRLAPGWNTIVLAFVDGAGNGRLETRRVFYDDGPPVVRMQHPLDGAVLGSRTVHVRGTVTHQPVDEAVTVNGAPMGVVNLAFDGLIIAPGDGPLAITVLAVDRNGKVGSASVGVVVDTLPPVIRPDIADRTAVNRSDLLLTGTVEGATVLLLDGQSVLAEFGHFSEHVQLTEGWNQVVLVARDVAGNEAETLLHLRLDTVPPPLVVRRPSNGVVHADRVDFEGSTEPGARLLFISNDGTTSVLVLEDGNFTFTAHLREGHNSLRLLATDEAGNQARVELSVVWEGPRPLLLTDQAVDWVLIIGFTAGTLGAIALVSAEFSKYALIVALLPMFTRLRKEEVLDHRLRYAINGLILESPGIHYNAIIKELRLSNGVAVYHLRVLEQRGFIRAIRDGTMKRFYPTAVRLPQDRAPTPEETRDHIIAIVGSSPGISQKDVAKRVGMDREAVGYHLRELAREGALKAEKDGRFTVYHKGDGKGR